jgi:hypothetical protein
MTDEEEILNWCKKQLKTVHGSVSVSNLRRKFNIGYGKAKRCCDKLVDGGEAIKCRNLGYISKQKPKDKHPDNTDKSRHSANIDKHIKNIEKQNQRLRDLNNLLKKKEREFDRESIKVETILNGIKANIDIINGPYKKTNISLSGLDRVAIVQLSDTHFNECVRPETVKGSNEYNWEIAAKRLQKYAHEVKGYLSYHKIDTIIFALTGDMFNSSRFMEELVDNQDSLCVALLTGADLVSKFILDVSSDGLKKSYVYSVFGNESRIRQDYTSIWWEDSWDYLCHKIVEMKLAGYSTIEFEEPTLDHSLVIRNVLGANILLIHGHNKTDYNKELSKYANHPDLKCRCVIDYMLWGHIHETQVRAKHRRSSSLVGNNAYSYHRLGLQGYAEQNLHILIKETDDRVPVMRTIPINLDYTGNLEGYDLVRDSLYRRGKEFNGNSVRQFPGL